jgi:hypothetical protein
MKSASIVLVAALAAAPMTAPAQRAPSGATHAAPVPGSATHAAPIPGLVVHSGAPTGVAPSGNGTVVHNQTIGSPAVFNKSTNAKIPNGAPIYGKSTNVATPYHPAAPSAVDNRTSGNNNYNGRVIVNPVDYGSAWGWNRGVVWMPQGAYWGGAFFGPFGPGAATTAEIMGSIIDGNHTYPSYGVSSGSPGATLLSNYGLRQVRCGLAGLVVIHGPNFGVVCAYPNARVGAGSYNVNTSTLTLQSQ